MFLAAQHDASTDDPKAEDIYTMGAVANVVQSLKLPDGNIKVLVEGLSRVSVSQVAEREGALHASNVQLVCPECGKMTRIGHRIDGDRKVRICRKCEGVVDK